jgi:hypothetical protein
VAGAFPGGAAGAGDDGAAGAGDSGGGRTGGRIPGSAVGETGVGGADGAVCPDDAPCGPPSSSPEAGPEEPSGDGGAPSGSAGDEDEPPDVVAAGEECEDRNDVWPITNPARTATRNSPTIDITITPMAFTLMVSSTLRTRPCGTYTPYRYTWR